MKKWFTIDAFIVAFIAAVGYGFGYSIPAAFGLSAGLSLVICLAVGILIEMVAEEIMFSRFTQEKSFRKLLVFSAFIILFLICHFISMKLLGSSLFENLEEEFGYVILFSVGGFLISSVKLYYRTVKIRKKYGDGEEGFRFDADEKAYISELNQTNAEIKGEYDQSLAVKTRTGIYVGEKYKDVISFNGIPYAKPPVGDLRWKAPEKLPDSDKVFEAKHYGPSAIQVNYKGNPLSMHQQSEDCLYLNVWTANIEPKEKNPVVVYFHGGDFTYGGVADPLWEMWSFVKKHPDVVAVSFNYRLGLLGFIDFSAVSGGEEYPDAANLGLLDQIAALEWVKENIASFGGDPERITVMGDGAGGVSIGLLSSCARVKGLFRKAILFSGIPRCAQIGGNYSTKIASELLKATGASNMDDLLAIEESTLSTLTQDLQSFMAPPKCDGKLIPADIYEAYKNGIAKDIQFILSAAEDTASAYSASVGRGLSEDLFAYYIEMICKHQKPEMSEKLKKLIADETKRIGKAKAEARFLNLFLDHIGMVQLSEALQSGGCSVRNMYWNVDAVIKDLGISDVNIVSTVLGNQEAANSYGSVVNDSVRDVLQALIVKVILDEAPELYNNEVDGVSAIKWSQYPDILAIGKKEIRLQSVEDALSDAMELIQAII